MPKRGENIRKRKDGRWEGRYIISYNLEGKASYQSVYGKSYAEVKQKMKEKQGITAKQKPVTGNVGFDVLCLAWLKEVRVEVKESTYADYYDKVHNHIIPPLGKLKAKMMGVDLINRFGNAQLLCSCRCEKSVELAHPFRRDYIQGGG